MPAGDFSARSVRSSDEVKSKLGASHLSFGLQRANALNRVVMDSRNRHEEEIAPFPGNAKRIATFDSEDA